MARRSLPGVPFDRPPRPGPLDAPREFRADFEVEAFEVDGASTARRPDAISIDYLTAFTLGPVAEGDNSQGPVGWAWYAADRGGEVYFARENASGDGWGEETLLMAYEGAPILELDFCFEQNGRPVLCAERATGADGASELWIYWFDPTLNEGTGAFIFENMGAGRTPRCILDTPQNPGNSDVLVFYQSDADGRTAYRMQRERYETPNLTPGGTELADVSNAYIEDVVRTASQRLVVIYSVRDPEAGTYDLTFMATELDPIALVEQWEVLPTIEAAEVIRYILPYSMGGPEEWRIGHEVSAAELVSIVITEILAPEEWTLAAAVSAAQLVSIVMGAVLPSEEWAITPAVSAAEVERAITIIQDLDAEQWAVVPTVQSAVVERV